MNEDLQQQLMEFVYGLLDDAEADSLAARITSDPQVARAYAKVKLQCDLVGRAARFDAPAVAWIRPDETAVSNDADLPAAPQSQSTATYRRLANWCIGLAAAGLVCLMSSALWMPMLADRQQPATRVVANAAPVQVVLTGPSRLNAEVSNPFTVQIEDQAGTPVSTTLNYRVFDDQGTVRWQDSTSTDKWGNANFNVDGQLLQSASRLEVMTAAASPAPILRDLETAPERFATYLRTDRPLYRPGEPVLYRSVTLSRFGLRAEREVAATVEIVDAQDEPLAGSRNLVTTEQGVGSGMFQLPADLPDGNYTLIARSPDNLFREEWRDFQVRRYRTPRLLQKLELARDSYTAGDQVDFDFSAKRVAGEPLAQQLLGIEATLDGAPLSTPTVTTDDQGQAKFSLTLPESIERGEATVRVTVPEGDESAETITKEIPINLGKVNVDFYPEGGDLAADLPGRVYFYGRDPLGKPTHIEGRIVDANGREIAPAVTVHEGRGVVAFMPSAGEQYRLMIDKPASVTKEVPLPVASPSQWAAIDTGEGVFAAGSPVTFTLHQRNPAKSLIVAAYCRGAMVGQLTIEPEMHVTEDAAFATFHGELPLPKTAQGVIRLTVFDAAPVPPEPIAERLVYRRVGQKLDVQITPNAETFAPGQAVELAVQIRDEHDAPVPAALGIAVVDDAVLNLADDKSVRLPTYFHLLTELDSPVQLEDANFYLAETPASVAALDALLGTQGWRRFRESTVTQLALAPAAAGFGGGANDYMFQEHDTRGDLKSLAWTDEAVVPLQTAATLDIPPRVARQSAPSNAPTAAVGKLRMPSVMIGAGIVLLVLVGVASFEWMRGNLTLRLVAAGIAVAAIVLGFASQPVPPGRSVAATGDAAPAAADGASWSVQSDGVMAGEEAATLSDDTSAQLAEGMTSELAEPESAAEIAPLATQPPKSAPSQPLQEQRDEEARFAMPSEPLARKADAGDREQPTDELRGADKKQTRPAPPRPLASDAPATDVAQSFQMQQPAAEAIAGRAGGLPAMQSKAFEGESQRRILEREYAPLFYDRASRSLPADEPNATIFWLPLHKADATGRASVYFDLPKRPSSTRAIVEAHGAGRLGAGDLLIDAR